MATLPIIIEPDPRYNKISNRLRQPSEPVEEITDDIRELVEAMRETMMDAVGVGLAAPQVGVYQRIVTIYVPEDYQEEGSPEMHFTLINPEIVKAGGRQSDLEGCLSFPDLVGEVDRYGWVIVKYLDLDGNKQRMRAKGTLAQIFQHEIDHLDGVLFFDRMDSVGDVFHIDELRRESAEEEEAEAEAAVTE